MIKEEQKTKLKLKLEDNSEHELECFIKEVEKDRISLTFPKEHFAYAKYLQEGDEINVNIFTPSGIKVFNSIILDSPLDSPAGSDLVIEYIEDHTEIQRREYLRSSIVTKIIIERYNGEIIITKTIDIGGGGVKFFYEGNFLPNERAKCRLFLPLQVTSIQSDGTISYKPHLKENEHVIMFNYITNNDRARIIKKCFEIQASGQDEDMIE